MTLESPHDLPRPEPPSTAAIEAFCQYLRLLELEVDVDWQGYRDERPELALELERLLAEYERVTAILEALAPAASFSARLRAHYGDSVDPGISLSGDLRAEEGALDAPEEQGSKGSGSASAGVLQRLSAQSPVMGRYEARREIARGGMGAILEVWDSELRRTLAMKVVLTGRDSKDADDSEGRAERRLSRFLEEAQITGQLDHPGIVPVHDIGIDDTGRVFFTMQLVDGMDLRKVFELARLERDGWTQRRVMSVLIRVCEAMAYAHSKGVVHRDLKPANIMVGSFGEAFVMDWGLAKVVGTKVGASTNSGEADGGPSAAPSPRGIKTNRSDKETDTDSALKTLDGDVVGTPAYMAPEQARGRLQEIGPHSDVYAIGAMLYHLLSGHMPYEPLGEKVAAHTILEAVRNGPPWPLTQLNPEVDGELAAICARAMEREPAKRYSSVMAVGDDLRAWVEGRGVEAYTSGVLYETRKWMERNRTATGALVALIGLAMVSVLLFIWQQQANFSKLEREQRIAEEQRAGKDQAEAELKAKIAELNANEQELIAEAARAQRATEVAQEQQQRSNQATERANLSAESARRSELTAVRAAYRSHINAAAYSLRLSAIDEARVHLDGCAPSLRGWEWYHLRLATDASIGEPIVHERAVTELAVKAGGAELLSYGFGLPPRLWDVESRRMKHELNAVASLAPFTFSRNLSAVSAAIHPLRDLVVLREPSTPYAQAFNVQTNTAMRSYKPKGGVVQEITDLAISADGDWVVTVSRNGIGSVYELSGGNEVLSYQYWKPTLKQLLLSVESLEPGELECVALSADGAFAVAGTADGKALVWDLGTGKELLRVEGHHGAPVNDVEVSGDGLRILTASDDGSVGVWDVQSGALLAMMHGHVGAVNAALFSGDGSTVVSGGDDLTLRSWDASSGRQLRVFHGHGEPIEALVSLNDSRHVASASLDKTVRIWDLGWDPSLTRIYPEQRFAACSFAPDGRTLLLTHFSGRPQRVDLDTGRELSLFVDGEQQVGEGLVHLNSRLSPDGGLLVVGLGDRSLRVYDSQSGELRLALDDLGWGPRYLAFSSDSRYLAVSGRGRQVLVLDLVGEGESVSIGFERKLRQAQRTLRGMDLSPDGRLVATVDLAGDLRIWDAHEGSLIESKRGAHELALTSVLFSPDGRSVITTSKDRSIRSWSLGGLELEQEFKGHSDAVLCATFSPDGTRLATGDSNGEVRLWSVESGEVMVEWVRVGEAVLDVEFSPDGTRLAACGTDMGVQVWESKSAEERYEHRDQDLKVEGEARALVDELFVQLPAPSMVETAVVGDASIEHELRERALVLLDERRQSVDYCRSIVMPLLDCGAGRLHEEHDYRVIAAWLEELRQSQPKDLRVLGLLGAAELRLGESQLAIEYLDQLRELGDHGPRVDLYEGLARSAKGEQALARELLKSAQAKLTGEASEQADLLAELLLELQVAVGQDEGGEEQSR